MHVVGVVVIGRNEGERLRRCLTAVGAASVATVYVDSGSSDGSVALARALGCAVVELDPARPFTPGRARNAGFARLRQVAPEADYVQFVDGDCTLIDGWLAHAARELEAQPDVAVVAGRQRELHPDASIYNRLCDLEWQRPVGGAAACGGLFMIRAAAFAAVGGFDPALAAGEEPDLCRRLRARGWAVRRLEAEMARHDAAMTRFRQWRRRCVRGGWAYGQRLLLDGRARRPRGALRIEMLRLWLWAVGLPLAAVGLAIAAGGWGALLALAYPLQLIKIAATRRRRMGTAWRHAWLYAAFCLLAKWPLCWGMGRFWWEQWRGEGPRIIEYKASTPPGPAAPAPGAPGAPGPLRLAYLNSRYPSLSHTFIEREIQAVRAAGIEVQPFSIRRPGAADTLGAAHGQAARETIYLLARGPLALAALQVRYLVARPWRYGRMLLAAQAAAAPGLRARLRALAHAIEAVTLAHELRRRQLRHVHVHMANSGAAVARLAAVFDPALSYSLTIHGSAEFFNVAQVGLRPKAEGALFVRAISDFCRAQVMAWTAPRCWPRVHVVHCGVDPAAFAPRPAARGGPFRMLTVGRLVPVKGYPLLLRAARELLDRGLDWRLDLVGEGELRGALERLARELGVSERVEFSGAVGQDRIQPHFDRADVLVVSSFMEGVPVVLLEAMAKQVPGVATQVAGIPELIRDGVEGLLCPPGSAAALADALARAAADRGALAVMGVAARRRIVADFALEQVGTQMAALFRQYLSPSAVRVARAEAGGTRPEAEPGVPVALTPAGVRT